MPSFLASSAPEKNVGAKDDGVLRWFVLSRRPLLDPAALELTLRHLADWCLLLVDRQLQLAREFAQVQQGLFGFAVPSTGSHGEVARLFAHRKMAVSETRHS